MKTCSRCFGKIGRGISHKCTEAYGVKNLVAYAKQLGSNFDHDESKSLERVGSSIVKQVIEERGGTRGEPITMATGTFKEDLGGETECKMGTGV